MPFHKSVSTPISLIPELYSAIVERMLSKQLGLPSGLISQYEAGSPRQRCGFRDYDTSLARQLGELTTPDAFVFTVNSAIPVADSIRGYYQRLGLPTPTLAPVAVSQRKVTAATADDPQYRTLRAQLAGAESVAVVDQHVASGATVQYAAELLLSMGVTDVSVIRGSWYMGASDVDLEGMTSPHANFLHGVGHAIAERD